MTRGFLLWLVGLGLLGGSLLLYSSFEWDWSDINVSRATLAAGVVAIGWITTFWLREISTHTDRTEKSRDLQLAIRAEVSQYADILRMDDAAQRKRELVSAVDAAGDGKGAYHPYFAKLSAPVVYDALVNNIQLLPERTIVPVVEFYATLSDLSLLLEEAREPKFQQLSATRRILLYKDIIDTWSYLGVHAWQTVQEIDNELSGIPKWMTLDADHHAGIK